MEKGDEKIVTMLNSSVVVRLSDSLIEYLIPRVLLFCMNFFSARLCGQSVDYFSPRIHRRKILLKFVRGTQGEPDERVPL